MEGTGNKIIIRIDPEKVRIFALYFFLTAGGVWHLLNVLQPLMRQLASPLLIFLAVWISWEYVRRENSAAVGNSKAFLIWASGVVILSFLIELVGVKTGAIFGEYRYGATLYLQISRVPVAIGFAWLCMLITSAAVLQRNDRRYDSRNDATRAAGISVLMVMFDTVMEPAATALGYWHWQNGSIPAQNYLAWFVISFGFAWAGLRAGLFKDRIPAIAFHAYFAQLIYFALVIIRYKGIS